MGVGGGEGAVTPSKMAAETLLKIKNCQKSGGN